MLYRKSRFIRLFCFFVFNQIIKDVCIFRKSIYVYVFGYNKIKNERVCDMNVIMNLLNAYEKYLIHGEKSIGTREKYLRDVMRFLEWLKEEKGVTDAEQVRDVLTLELVAKWRDHMKQSGYAAVTVNSMLGAINSFLRFIGRNDCRAKYLRIQSRMFRKDERSLSRKEYDTLIAEAEKQGRLRLELLMETICATGIRVSEVQFITVESAIKRKAEISLKGKIRTILIPKRLAKKLLTYCKKEKIISGEVFLSKNKKSLSRKQIWAEMKALCINSGISDTKVFPHNLRHLFATTFYEMYQDIVRLADVLGHSCMDTTRIYLMTPERDHIRQLERMNLVT